MTEAKPSEIVAEPNTPDPKESVFALLLQEFIDEKSEFGISLEGVDERGVATVRQKGMGSINVSLTDGTIDPRKMAPDSKIVVELTEKMKQTPIPTEAMSMVPVGVGGTIAPQIDQQLSVDDVVNYINPDATKSEAWMFLQYCRSMGLNPLARDVHLVVYSGEGGRKCNFIAGKESFAKRAEANSNFDGFKAGIIVRRDDGAFDYREGTFLVDGETLLGGWCEVYRRDRTQPFKAAVALKDYDTGKSVWRTKKATMIRKVAFVQAHREAFPGALGGMYDQAEMGEGF